MPLLRPLLRRLLLLLGLLALALPVAAALAQEPPPKVEAARPAPVDIRQLEDLVGRLEDPAAREQFLQDLKAVIAAQKAVEPETADELFDIPAPETLGARLIFAISAGIRGVSESILEGVSVARDLPAAGDWLRDQMSRRESRNFWLGLVTRLVLVVIGGWAAEWLLRRLLAPVARRLEAAQPAQIAGRLLLAFARAAVDLLPILGFALVAYGLLPLTDSSDRARFVVLAVVNSHVFVGIVLAAARLVLMPGASNLRALRFSDETAVYLYIWTRRLAALVIYGYFAAEVAALLGAEDSVKAFIRKLVGLVTVAMLIVLVMQNRKPVAHWLRGRAAAGETAPANALAVFRRRLADVWHVLVALYLFAFYVVWVLDIGFAFLLRSTALTILVLVVARLLILSITQVVARAFRVGHELTLRYPGLDARANRYLPVLGRVLRGLIYLAAGLLILQAWGVESLAWLTSRDGVRFVGAGLGIIVVLGLALILWETISLGLDRYAARLDGTARSSARVRTLLPLLRTVIVVVLSVMVGLVVLSQIGINITPLLAGAGVIGLAVGFGSQKLVQDVINGLFILAEDTVSVGDIIDLDGKSGVVEEITIRHIRLRDMAGNVITVPFSEVKTVINMTRDYSRYVFDIGIGYREDVDQVIAVLQALDEEMRQDPRFGPLINAPLEIIGLDRFADSAVILKARYTTQPRKQWDIGREFNRRIKNRFDQLGIEIPFPSLTLHRAPALSAKAKGGKAAGLPEPDAENTDTPSSADASDTNPSIGQP